MSNTVTKNYYLISKNIGQKFVRYEGDALRLKEGIPNTVDEIIVGIKGKPNEQKKITTFRDSKGKIIERAFDYPNKPYKNRIYTPKDYTIGNDEYVNSTTIKEFSLRRAIINVYNEYKEIFNTLHAQTTLWNKGKVETNHISENINNGERIFSKVSVKPSKKSDIHTFIEYPTIGKVEKKNKIKSLEFKVNPETNKVNEKSIKGKLIQNPQKDEFLGIRALDIDDAKVPMTKHYIHKRELEKAEIEIHTNYDPKEGEDKLVAFYADENGTINFNRLFQFNSKAELAKTSAHETEHGWQWYLHARNTGGETAYTKTIHKKQGPLKDKDQIAEAEIYTNSIKNYVKYDENYEDYKKNVIEILAYKKGAQAELDYNKQGIEIREAFKHIPTETL